MAAIATRAGAREESAAAEAKVDRAVHRCASIRGAIATMDCPSPQHRAPLLSLAQARHSDRSATDAEKGRQQRAEGSQTERQSEHRTAHDSDPFSPRRATAVARDEDLPPSQSCQSLAAL